MSRRLLACAVAALLGGCGRPAPAPAAAPRSVPARSAVLPTLAALPLAPPAALVDPVNLFGAVSWQTAPSPAPAPPPSQASEPAPAAPAVAPPLPFRFLGRYGDADSHIVMLIKGEQLYLAAVGDTIEGVYRVDRVSAHTVELTYLPLKLTQSLSTGDAG